MGRGAGCGVFVGFAYGGALDDGEFHDVLCLRLAPVRAGRLIIGVYPPRRRPTIAVLAGRRGGDAHVQLSLRVSDRAL